MLESTDRLLDVLYDLDAALARRVEMAIAEEREAGYQEGWAHRDNWGAV